MVSRILVGIVGLLVVGVAVGAGYFYATQNNSVTPPGTAPTVTVVSPVNAATAVALNSNVAATFSIAMTASSLSSATFTLKQGTAAVAGVVTYAGTTATFDPTLSLAASTTFVATITTGVKSAAGTALAVNYVWNFTTGQASDLVAPTVTFTAPGSAATGTAINAKVLVTFSEAMDPSTVTTATFLLMQAAASVSGTVTFASPTATFDPNVDFAPSTTYTATVTIGAKDLAGNALAAPYTWSFTTGALADTTAPTVVSTVPTADAAGVALDLSISATFSEAMDASTISAATFLLMQGATPVTGAVTYASLAATFNPASDLAAGTTYTATLTVAIKDLAGNALLSARTWSFTTSVLADTTAPTVVVTSPDSSTVGVPIGANLSATFSEAMNASTITAATFMVMLGTFDTVPGTITYDGLIATFNPDADFAYNTTYNAGLSTGAKDLAGNALVVHAWDFTTELDTTPPDTQAPEIFVTSPAADATGVMVDAFIQVTFSEPMRLSSFTPSTFSLMQGATPVSGARSFDIDTATLDPMVDLDANTTYTATITTGVLDLAGNALVAELVWNFTTAGASCAAPAPVDLGSAADFAVLAGSTVTNTGATTVTGDLGVSPGTAVTGFGPGVVVGHIHAGNLTAQYAIENVTLAYNDLAGRTLCSIAVAGNLGGQTLTPGLYTSTSSLEVSSGDLTLDALGDVNAIFIFQIASTLDIAGGLHVNLTGGAKASNVFWQVGTSATINAGAVMVGTIIADQSITIGTGATLDGRALARVAAVSLDACTVTKPSP